MVSIRHTHIHKAKHRQRCHSGAEDLLSCSVVLFKNEHTVHVLLEIINLSIRMSGHVFAIPKRLKYTASETSRRVRRRDIVTATLDGC